MLIGHRCTIRPHTRRVRLYAERKIIVLKESESNGASGEGEGDFRDAVCRSPFLSLSLSRIAVRALSRIMISVLSDCTNDVTVTAIESASLLLSQIRHVSYS